MKNTMRRTNTVITGIVGAVTLSLFALPATAIQWTGGGDGTTFSQGSNWQGGVAPASSADDVEFGDLSPDSAQTITLDASVTVDQVILTATGNRSYTINDDGGSETLSIRSWSSSGTNSLTQNARTLYTDTSEFQPWGSSGTLTINGSHDRTGGTGAVVWQGSAGTVKFNSDWGTIGGGNAAPVAFQPSGSDHVLNHENAVAEPGETSSHNITANAQWSMGTDTSHGNVDVSAARTLSLRFDGRSGTSSGSVRTVTLADGPPNGSGTIAWIDDAPGSAVDGGVTLKVNRGFGSTMSSPIDFGTQTDAILEISPQAGPGLTVSSSITGPGTVKVNGGTNAVTMGAANILPDAGKVTVTSGSTLFTDGNDDTIAGLGGGGTVSGGGTLTVNDELAPGDSVGTLNIIGGVCPCPVVTLTLGMDLAYAYEADGLGADDSVSVTGDINFPGGITLQIAVAEGGTAVDTNDVLVLFSYTGTANIGGTTFTITAGPNTSVDGSGAVVNDTGSQITLTGITAEQTGLIVPITGFTEQQTVAIEFSCDVGTLYELQSTLTATGEYTTTGAFMQGNGGTCQIFDPTGTNTTKFYRVITVL